MSKEMATKMTYGITIEELECRLRQLLPEDSTMVQWSSSYCDYYALASTVSKDCIPPQERWLNAISGWRRILPSIHLGLLQFFHDMYPKSPLNDTHHRAKIDTQKLYNVTKRMANYLKFGKPMEGVTMPVLKVGSVVDVSGLPSPSTDRYSLRRSGRHMDRAHVGGIIGEEKETLQSGTSSAMDLGSSEDINRELNGYQGTDSAWKDIGDDEESD